MTAQGSNVAIAVSGNSVTVKGTNNPTPAAVTNADILYFAGATFVGPNLVRPGVLHVVDKVLLP
jgi:uncharacterized surface protein with fasciclin (FAS1) repeats